MISLLRELIVEIFHEKSDVIVYHASPQLHLTRIMPRYSRKFDESGVFVTDSLKSIWDSWASWALQKPGKRPGSRTNKMFENVAVYTIRIPRVVFEKAEKAHIERASAAMRSRSPDAFGAWGWDNETFIPESMIANGFLEPSSVKVYTKKEILDIIGKSSGWRSAGRRPHDEMIPLTKKNPARAAYAELKEKVELAALKRGGRIGSEQQGNFYASITNPQLQLNKEMGILAALARKTRLTPEDEGQLNKSKAIIEDLLSIQVKELSPRGVPYFTPRFYQSSSGPRPRRKRGEKERED